MGPQISPTRNAVFACDACFYVHRLLVVTDAVAVVRVLRPMKSDDDWPVRRLEAPEVPSHIFHIFHVILDLTYTHILPGVGAAYRPLDGLANAAGRGPLHLSWSRSHSRAE